MGLVPLTSPTLQLLRVHLFRKKQHLLANKTWTQGRRCLTRSILGTNDGPSAVTSTRQVHSCLFLSMKSAIPDPQTFVLYFGVEILILTENTVWHAFMHLSLAVALLRKKAAFCLLGVRGGSAPHSRAVLFLSHCATGDQLNSCLVNINQEILSLRTLRYN